MTAGYLKAMHRYSKWNSLQLSTSCRRSSSIRLAVINRKKPANTEQLQCTLWVNVMHVAAKKLPILINNLWPNDQQRNVLSKFHGHLQNDT